MTFNSSKSLILCGSYSLKLPQENYTYTRPPNLDIVYYYSIGYGEKGRQRVREEGSAHEKSQSNIVHSEGSALLGVLQTPRPGGLWPDFADRQWS